MYPIFRKPQSRRLPTTAEHPSQNNHIASQRSVTTSADNEGVESVASDDDADFTLKTFPNKEAIDYWMAGASARGHYLGHR
ncbi:hypothetical protein HaLaN_13054, partial [Haematococcus lacustris]